MKQLKFYWFYSLLAVLVGAISLASVSTVQANPIFDGPANTPNSCMADAYYNTGGKGLKNNLGASLNCTANDVEITTVTVTQVDGSGPDGEGNFTCSKGEFIEVTADLRVRTNANERWDTTFYLPLNQESPQVIQQDPEACSIVIPKTEYANDPDSGISVAQDLDGDVCGDISKGPLVNDEYTLVDATFTMLCEAGDDTQVDFIYCAGWDNQERENCSATDAYPGQEPNTTSKCNCGDIPLNIFIQPEPPLVTKTLVSDSSADEPQGTYIYTLRVETQTPEADLTVTALSDYLWSLTDADSTLYEANLVTGTIVPSGSKFTFLVADTAYTCDDVVLPKVLNASTLAFECDIVVQIDDDDLPDDQSDELYRDVFKVIAEDDNADNIGECIEPLTVDTKVDGACSNEIEVAVQDVTPTITIDKFAIAGPGYECIGGTVDGDGKCSGTVYIDEPGGDVTYKLVITNTSTVDPLTIGGVDDGSSLTDVVGTTEIDLLDDITGNTCDDSLPINLAINGETGDSFTCQFERDVSGGLITVHNDATVVAAESDGHSEGNAATHTEGENVTITDVPPAVSLLKKVRAIGGPDDQAFADSAVVYEPEGDVVYQFTVRNTSPALESITLLSLTDAVLAGSRVTVTGGDCAFDGSIIIPIVTDSTGTNPYVCTIEATVTGDASGELSTLVNTAYVTVTDGVGENIDSNDDTATVTFEDVSPLFSLDFGFSTVVYVKISTVGVDAFEDLTLQSMKIRNILIPLPNGDAGDDEGGVMNIINDNQTRMYRGDDYESCEIGEVIEPETVYYCNFVVEHLVEFADIDFDALASGDGAVGPVEVILTDPENNAVKFEADVEVDTTKRGPL